MFAINDCFWRRKCHQQGLVVTIFVDCPADWQMECVSEIDSDQSRTIKKDSARGTKTY